MKVSVQQSVFSFRGLAAFRFTKRSLVILTLLILMSGCAGKIAYNNADFIISWYLSDYIEFTPKQEPIAKAKIDDWLAWHRSSEMPKYLNQLTTLKQQIQEGKINSALLQKHSDQVEYYWQTVRQHIARDVSDFAMTLDISQMSKLFLTLADKREEDIQDFKEQTKKQPKPAQRILKNIEERLGYVTDKQRKIVNEYAQQLNSTYDMWMAHNANIQTELRQILIAKDFVPNSAQHLENLIINTDQKRSAEYTAARIQNKRLYITMLSDMFPTLESAQRKKLIAEIDTYIELVQDIIAG